MKNSKTSKKSIIPRWFKILFLFLIVILFVFILLGYALTKPKVQNWATQKITSFISKDIKGRIEVDSLSLDYSKGLNLHNVGIFSDQNDTLLSIGYLSSTLKDNLKSVLRNELYLDEIIIKEVYLNLDKEENAKLNNWQALLSNLIKPRTKRKNNDNPKFHWELSAVHFEDIKIRNNDEGNELYLNLPSGFLSLNKLDLDSMYFDIGNLELISPFIRLANNKIHKKRDHNIDNLNDHEGDNTLLNEETQDKDEITAENATKLPIILVGHLHIQDGYFDNVTPKIVNKDVALDYRNFNATDVNLDVKDFIFDLENESRLSLDHFSVLLDHAFKIEKMASSNLSFTDRKINIQDYLLNTSNSQINLAADLKYRNLEDFQDFANRVFLDFNFNNSQVAIKDIAYLIPAIEKEDFIQKNISETIFLNGIINGRVNNFSTQELSLIVPNKVTFTGDFRARNILDSESATTINVKVEKLNTSMYKLSQVIPNFNPPDNFYKLGDINFKGRFDGFVDNFVAFGDLTTELGRAVTDMQLDLAGGRQNAKYSGDLELFNFDLAEWSGNDDFGIVSFTTSVKNGSGLTSQNATADLDASLNSFYFKEHLYEDLQLDGKLEKNLFIGKFLLNDPSAIIDFDGSFIYEDEKVRGDFVAQIDKLNLKGLNLSKDSIEFYGNLDVELFGSNLDDFEGEAMIRDLSVSINDKSNHFDSIYIASTPKLDGRRYIEVISEALDLALDGRVNFNYLYHDFVNLVSKENPAWSEYLIVPRKDISDRQDFKYKVHIEDSKNLLAFFDLPELSIKKLDVYGSLNSKTEKIELETTIDTIIFKENQLSLIDLNFLHDDGQSNLDLNADQFFSGNTYRDFISLSANLKENLLTVGIIGEDQIDSLISVDFLVEVLPVEKNLHMHIIENKWKMLNTDWFFNPDNKIIYGDKYIELQNVGLDDGQRSIEITSRNGKDILLQIKELDFELLNPIIDYDNIYFSGPINVILQADNVFEKPLLLGSVQMDSIVLNGDNYGAVSLYVNENSDKDYNLDLDIFRASDGQIVRADVLVDKETMELDGELIGENFKIELFEYIIKDGISETHGDFDLKGSIKGNIPNIKLRGIATVEHAGVTVNYLGNHFTMSNQEVRITEKIIDVSNSILNDKYGNEATLTGGLYHDFFGDFSLGLKIESDKFLMLDTDKFDNSSYYGSCTGAGLITFEGPFSHTNIIITATTLPGTTLNIPVESDYTEVEESFIQFVKAGTLYEFDKDTTELQELVLEGSNVEMNLTITPDALVNIIFDDRANDKISGRGRGNIRMISERTGTFDVFGRYTVESGEYLFTAFSIVAKPFKVKRGGTVVWTGDPLDATLNIQAEYEGLNSPVSVFLAEYISASGSSEALQQEAKRSTEVDLGVIITGSLFNPEINFDIELPELQGELKSHANNKLRILRQNSADMNDQVAGLLLFGSFLPSNDPLAETFYTTNNLSKTTYNTVSEFISSQLSYLLSGLVEEALVENGLISGIDFEIGFSKNDIVNNGQFANTGLAPDEIEVHFKPRFKNDRWSVDLGTNYVRESNTISTQIVGNYLFYNTVLEYALTEDRRLKLRVYGKNDYDEIVSAREWKYGVGIRYRKEFGTLAEFKESFKQQIKADLNSEGNGK